MEGPSGGDDGRSDKGTGKRIVLLGKKYLHSMAEGYHEMWKTPKRQQKYLKP